MENNVGEESFHFRYTKQSFFIFWVHKMGCFVKQLPNICCKFEPHQFLNILDHVLCTNKQMVAFLDKFLPIQFEAGQIGVKISKNTMALFKTKIL